MTPDQYQRVREIFHRACELDPAAQDAFLAEACDGDREILAEVRSLLTYAADAPDAFRDDRIGIGRALVEIDTAPQRNHGESLPESISGYRIIRKIGEGGMGVVYEAEQKQPLRRVALKVLRPGLNTRSLLRRFAQEAQVLSRFQHPGIAHVYEAGTASTSSGEQPFFAMELVNGLPLNVFASRNALSMHDRLRLFARLCDAVHHAHTRGIVHRDLKPANILIVEHDPATNHDDASKSEPPYAESPRRDGTGGTGPAPTQYEVKILDFGIARATDVDIHLTTIQTAAGQLIGTVPYMSPEQVKGDPTQIDARSDVYSLGVLLYELLADRPPYDLTNRSIPEATRLILDAEPTRLSSISRVFHGDVDTIVSKALEKEPTARYQTAHELASDIRRYLAHEPIVARPASAMYQLRKFAKRNRALVGGVSFGSAAIIVGLVIAIHQAVVATQARNAAEQREQMRLRQTYRASIAAAASALENHDVALARRSLAMAPESLREWEWRHLSSRLDESLLTIATPDALRGASPWYVNDAGERDVLLPTVNGLIVWDGATGREIRSGGNPGTLYAQDHSGLASVSFGEGQIVVRRQEGTWTRSAGTVGLADETITRIAISEGGRFLALIGTKSVSRIDIETGEAATTEIDNTGTGVAQAALTPDGDVVLASAISGRPAIWNVTGGLVALEGVPAFARSVDVSPNGEYIVLGLQDTTIGLWRAGDRSIVGFGRGHAHAVAGVAFSPEGDRIASVSLDRTVRLWSAPSLEPFATFHGHDRGVWGVTFSRDGSRLVTTSEDQTLRIWPARRRRGHGVLIGHEGFVYSLALSPGAERLATAGWDHTIRLWDPSTAEQTDVLPVCANVTTALSFSADGRYLAWVGDDRFGAWDLSSNSEIIPGETAPSPPATSVRYFDFVPDAPIVPLPWTLDERGVTVWSAPLNTVAQWSVEALREHRSGLPGARARYAVGVAPGTEIADVRTARGDSGSLIRVIDLVRGERARLPEFSGPFALSPRGGHPNLIVARRADDLTRLEVWDLDRRQLVGPLIGHTDSVYAIAYSPDGMRIVTGGRDSLRLWDAETLDEIVQLRGHTSFVWSLLFSPDGRQLISGSGDNTARIWNTLVDNSDERAGSSITISESSH